MRRDPAPRRGRALRWLVLCVAPTAAAQDAERVFHSGFEAGGHLAGVFANPDPAVLRAGEPLPGPDQHGASFRIKCHASHLNYDDSIVYPGESGRAHLHLYLGNTATDARHVDTESFLRSTSSTCQGGHLNRSGYWIPAMLAPRYGSDGELQLPPGSDQPVFAIVRPLGTGLHPDRPGFVAESISFAPDVYYKSATDAVADIQPMPEGLRFIAGDMLARPDHFAHNWHPNEGSNPYNWSCESWQGEDPRPADLPHIPICPVGDTVNLSVRFPMCWDGVRLDSPDHKAHMAFSEAFPREGGGWRIDCPPSHPVALTQVSYNFGFPVTADNASPSGDTAGWRLSSDMYRVSDYRIRPPSVDYAPGGFSAHGDWFMAWHPEVMQALITHCIQAGRDCSNGNLGNGFGLQGETPRPPDLEGSVPVIACGMGPTHAAMGGCR